MKALHITADVEELYIDNEGAICANIIIATKGVKRSKVIDITEILLEQPPK